MLFPSCLFAASFDCAQAKSKMEALICSNVELSKYDEDMATAYAEALIHASAPLALKKAQRDWLRTAQRCEDATCLETLFLSRIALLASDRNTQEATEHILGVCELVSYATFQLEIFPDIYARTYFAEEKSGVQHLAQDFYPAQITIVQQPKHGTVEPNSRGDWSRAKYRPNDDAFLGNDFFILQVEGNGHRKLKIYWFVYTPDSYGVKYNPNPACKGRQYHQWKISTITHNLHRLS